MAWRRRLVVAGALLIFSICSIIALSELLNGSQTHDGSILVERSPGQQVPLYPASEELIDLPAFQYVINTNPCGSDNVTGVVLVTSHAEHVEVRSAVRRAYPRAELSRLGLRRMFLLAVPRMEAGRDDWVQRALGDEARRFGDLVQGNFQEAYRNLTYKHTMGLQWATRYCPQARFVIKMDDDIVVNFYQLMDHLAQQPDVHGSLFGYVLRGLHPSREPANKWYVTREEYPADSYPDFLSGWLYATSPAVARALVAGAQRRPYFWIDDLVLTGLVREKLRPAPVLRNMSALFTAHSEVVHCCIAEPDLRCDVSVGPNGGENDLIVRFQEHAARCHYGQSCRARTPRQHVEKSCVVRGRGRDLPRDPGRGEARQVRIF